MIPTQFRIFKAGWNTSTKGSVLFDAQAAKAVMADYSSHGADLMLDLEHLSLDPTKPNYDPNARGWFKLQLRNGELWAIGFKTAGDGAERLEQKTQRYISPFFGIDKATKRVKFLVNAALTALPASDQPMALVAATGLKRSMAGIELRAASILTQGYTQMDLTAIAQCLGLPPEATIDDIVAAIKALQTAPASVAASEPGEGGASAPMVSETAQPSVVTPLNPAATTPKKTTVSIQHSRPADAAVLELSQEVATLRAERQKEKVEVLIAKNANKLTPILEKWARTQTPEDLEIYFAAASPVQVAPEAEPLRGATREESSTIKLTQAEENIARQTGVDPAAMLKYKQTQANQGSN